MKIVRTVTWIVITAVMVAFIAMNWKKVAVNFWPLDDGNYLHFEWPVGVVALLFFLLGLAPSWLYLRAVRWRMSRRIASLENSLRASSMPSVSTRSETPAASGASSPATPLETPSNPSSAEV
ncbi:lipopolysaccharide assembly protein LapA domain-containing protein [Novosphingobium beihaiensis]|uniref:LapA family protein n=1 Tax=Novosphingobium beihaiensis TaxID=2930389 RepID=A0ABT0BJW0_9SPHN|nr:lipopolysaccharide assembly protein LapA domain-containing protein [Novosphingobium beihaiensis]MCJ2185258.1 LapA family protein [Novosphingobium beihaiensis]